MDLLILAAIAILMLRESRKDRAGAHKERAQGPKQCTRER